MKKLFTLFSLALLSIATLSAQEQNEEKVVSSTYNRPSVSYLLVERDWHEAAEIRAFFNGLTIGEKYDENWIDTDYLDAEYGAGVAITSGQVAAALEEEEIAKEVMSYLFDRQDDGTFTDAIIKERGLYNANDQDIQNLEAAKVKDIAYEWGEPLVNSAYVVALDMYATKVTKSEDGKRITYAVNCAAHVFQLDGSQDVLNEFYETAWADASSSAEEKAAKSAAYDNMKFNLKYVTSVTTVGTSTKSEYVNGSVSKACQNAYESVIFNLEKQIDAWKTVVGVISTRPIAAKIGTKESVKNGDRFQAYVYKEDENGELYSVKRGMVRATVVANNKGVATGDTKPSYFYQISGAVNIKEGYTLQQSNDLKLGVAGTVGFTPNGFRAGLDMDYIGHISRHGVITYGMVNAGMNIMDVNYNGVGSLTDASVGFGIGIPVTRFFEITPSVMVGGYALLEDGSDSTGDDYYGGGYYDDYYYYSTRYDDDYYEETTEESADPIIVGTIIEPGVRLAVTLQPLSIFVSGGLHLAAVSPEFENVVKLDSGMFFKFGVKWTF